MDGTETYRVLVHNDDVTPMDFVRHAFHEVFGHGERKATKLTIMVHKRGVAEVARLPRNEALDRVERLQALARQAGHPLTASVTPYVEPASKPENEAVTLDVSGLNRDQLRLVKALIEQLAAN
jgi:ATP-dependent Clp protease adaptor protein ClpS